MNSLQIDKFGEQDFEAVLKLEAEYGKEMYSLQTLTDAFNNSNYHIYCAKLDGEVVGYLMVTIIMEECELLKIIVNNSHKRKGIASSLIERLKIDCQKNNIKHIYLEVRNQNLPANNLYKKIVFNKVSMRPKYYGDDDALIYRLDL